MRLDSKSSEVVPKITLTCAGVLRLRPGHWGWAWVESAFWGGATDREEPYIEEYICTTEPHFNDMHLDSKSIEVVQESH